jgi:hypothetical protein
VLAAWATHDFSLAEYGAAWRAADESLRPAVAQIEQALAQARYAWQAGALGEDDYRPIEQRLARVLNVVASADLRPGRE